MVGSLAAAALGGTILTDGASAASGAPTRLADSFRSIVNVAGAGADRSGERSINPVLERLRADDTLLYFPPGRYYMDRQFRFTGFENFGLYGNDATLVPANYHDNADDKHKMFRLGAHYAPGERVIVENFTVDFRTPDTGVRAFDVVGGKTLRARDIHVVGRHDSGMWGPGRFVVTDPDGEGLVERFYAIGGGAFSPETPSAGRLWRGPTGIICNEYNRGSIKFRRCRLGGFPDNGLYAGDTKGPVTVESGYYENSNVVSVRVGGPRPVVKWVTVNVEETSTSPHSEAHHGIRLQNPDNATVDGCEITVDLPIHGLPLKVTDGTTGETLVKDTKITVRGDMTNHAVDVSPSVERFKAVNVAVVQDTPGKCAFMLDGDGGEDWTRLVNCRVLGTPGHKYNGAAIYNMRDGAEFRNVNVHQGGGKLRTGLVNRGSDCLLYQCEIDPRRYPVIDFGDGTRVVENHFTSKEGKPGYYLADESSNVYLKRNVIENGIRNDGCDGLRMLGNDLE